MGFLKGMWWWIEDMRDNLFFKDENQLYNITLDRAAFNRMKSYCNIAYPRETGGILIGNYSLDQTTANVLQITQPPKKSKQEKYNFHRSCEGLKEVLDVAWSNDQYYLGEWHYHPDGFENPSSIDIKQMIALAKNSKLKCPEPILIIIGGSRENWRVFVGVFSSNGYKVLKLMNLMCI